MYDPTASASCEEFSPSAPHLAYRSLHHEVQRLTLQQARPAKLVQYMTFAAIECNLTATADCIARGTDTVKLVHAGVESPTAVSLTTSNPKPTPSPPSTSTPTLSPNPHPHHNPNR